MILSRDDIRELQGTGSVEVVVDRVPVSDTIKIQAAVGAAAVCVASVAETWEHRAGGYVVLLQHERRIKQRPPKPRIRRDTVRLLRPGGGTTTDARQAMRVQHDQAEPDTTGVPHPNLVDAEPERVDAETEEAMARENRDRHITRHRDEIEARLDACSSDMERLAFLKQAAHGAGIDVRSELRVLERRLLAKIDKAKRAA